jgi:hypothetical protein
LRLRIGTPFAAKRASLQENRGPDARSVMNRKLLHIKEDAFDFHNINSFTNLPYFIDTSRVVMLLS